MEQSKRTIWTMWYQGYDEAPYLVRAALDSWIRLNPDWQVVALDRRSLSDWIDLKSIVNLDRSDLTVQKVAVINRLCLLRRYGGIWTDGTVFCLRPVSEWLPEYMGVASLLSGTRDRIGLHRTGSSRRSLTTRY